MKDISCFRAWCETRSGRTSVARSPSRAASSSSGGWPPCSSRSTRPTSSRRTRSSTSRTTEGRRINRVRRPRPLNGGLQICLGHLVHICLILVERGQVWKPRFKGHGLGTQWFPIPKLSNRELLLPKNLLREFDLTRRHAYWFLTFYT